MAVVLACLYVWQICVRALLYTTNGKYSRDAGELVNCEKFLKYYRVQHIDFIMMRLDCMSQDNTPTASYVPSIGALR